MAPAAPKVSWTRHLARTTAEIFHKRWPRYFFFAAIVQAIICIVFESYVFARFSGSLVDIQPGAFPNPDVWQQVQTQLKTIPTFLSLFIFGFVYELVLVWDALRTKNTIMVIGLCVANLALLIYTALQIDQISEAVKYLTGANAVKPSQRDIWTNVKPLLIAIPPIIGVFTIALSLMAWKLYQEFAWDILKAIGADYRMKKRYLHYQIYIALLKFDFFFFVGFTVQFLVAVNGKTDTEFGLTAAAIPVTVGILLFAAWFTQKEIKAGVICVILLYLGGLAYFIFKLARIYQEGHKQDYESVRKSLTAFTVLTIVLIVLTIINALVCMFNFGQGLKEHLGIKAHPRDVDKDQASYSMDQKQPQLPSRMTID